MRGNSIKRLFTLFLSVVLMSASSLTSYAASYDTSSHAPESSDSVSSDSVSYDSRSYDPESDPLGSVDISKIHNPVTTSSGVTTWSYVMFGKYWQEDTNGDGYCFWEDTTITKTEDGKYYDQEGRRLYNFPEIPVHTSRMKSSP